MKKLLLILVFFICALPRMLNAQDDLMKMLDEVEKNETKKDKSLNKVTAMFKDPKIVNLQTPQTTGAGALNFNISHRFGNMGGLGNGGFHTLYGWDAISDVRLSFDYGITQNLQVGVGRNKRDEAIDGSVKWRFLDQTINNSMPLSVCLYSIASITPKLKSSIYTGADTAWIRNEEAKQQTVLHDRLTYTTQLILARKFAKWLSVVIAPTYTHRNYVLANINPSNDAADETDIYSVAAGFRLKITRSFSILADYFYVDSKYRMKNSTNPYYMPLSLGIEIETGGHVFHIDLTNAPGITENYFIPYSPDSWTKGGYKLGFNISRAFPMVKKNKKKKKAEESADESIEPEKTVTHLTSSETTPKQPVVEKPVITTPAKEMYNVTCESLNMRAGAGIGYPLIMKIRKGTPVEVIQKTNADWWKIKYYDETGYVAAKFLSK